MSEEKLGPMIKGSMNEPGNKLGAAVGDILYQVCTSKHTGNSQETYLEIVNATPDRIKITVSEVENCNWDGDSRPDHTFQGLEIEAGQTSGKLRQEVNAKCNTAWSTMAVSVDGQEKFKMRVNQWDALPEEPIDTSDRPHNDYLVKFVHQRPNNLIVTINKK